MSSSSSRRLVDSRLVRLGRSTMGGRLGGFIYGTIVVLAVLTAGAKAHPDDAGTIAALVAVTSAVFWVAHVYAHGLAQSVAQDEHLSLAELGRLARHEASIVEAAVPSVAILLLAALGLVGTAAAIWAAFGACIAVLALEGLVFARIGRLGALGTVTVVGANIGLGVLLVALKLALAH
jgi:hypothetical protein